MTIVGSQVDLLQRIVEVQAVIVQAELDLDSFMQVVVDTLQELTQAKGVVIERVEGESITYCYASHAFAEYIGLRLKRDSSLSGLCVSMAQALCCDDSESDPRVDAAACRCAVFGISLYRSPTDAMQWLREADIAMYRAKQQPGGGGSRVVIYQSDSGESESKEHDQKNKLQ